ncbi:MAG: HAMP domain-containing sensor histidine kinase [Bacilli bacterium]|nr:HAMP domain-containing sensor histidine kinase [Bacilli bacterium]
MVLEDVVDNFKQICREKEIELITEIPDDSIYIIGDYNRLTQVFINLFKNCVEAVDTNKDSIIEIISRKEKDFIKLNIRDNGIGMSEENLLKIMEPFFTTKKNGTGLGVSLAKEVIEAHQGHIKYTSKLGKGTLVEIILPLR